MPRVIVVADPDPAFTGELADYFAKELFQTVTANTGRAAQTAVARKAPGVVVVGTDFPDAPGLSLARWTLARPNQPGLIQICSRPDPIERTIAIEMGADDCLSKPVSPRELLARIHGLVRRMSKSRAFGAVPPEHGPMTVQGFSVNLQSRHVTLPSGETVVLSSTEAKVLSTLLDNRGSPVSRDELSQRALGRIWNPEERALDQHIATLRRKLFVLEPFHPLIHTVRNVGYIIDGEAQPEPPEA
jgi:DNA-binding response OmpR family regulator